MEGLRAAVVVAVALAVVAAMSATTHAQESRVHYVRADELRDHAGRCFDAARCSLRAEGQSWTVDDTCEEATCVLAPNGTLLERRTRCADPPSLALFQECYIVRVQGLAYPDCCPQLFCDGKVVSFSTA